MDMTIRKMEGAERFYCYAQSQQISTQAGLIGHLRADMDTNGKAFLSSFFNFRENLKSDAFRQDSQEVIDSLRENGFLMNRTALSGYCVEHPECNLGTGREFGVRVDTPHYSYMMRLNPNKGEYNLYCYCYVRQWLDRHIRQAEKGIRFITPDYQEIFRISDGDSIRITRSDGQRKEWVCRYVDEAHFEMGQYHPELFHICQFAEKCIDTGVQEIIPLRASLPEKCFSYLATTDEIIEITKGEQGYDPIVLAGSARTGREEADWANKSMGVTKAQEEAMVAGSMFGWEVSAADPRNYDDHGITLRPKQKDRGDAR